MVASGVGQFSINVKSNLKDFYGGLTKSQRTLKELTEMKVKLEADSSQLDKLRDKGQRIAAEMRELRQQKAEIKVGIDDKNISKLKKELSGVEAGIDNINKKKLAIQKNPKSVKDAEGMLKKLDSSLKAQQTKKISLQTELKNIDEAKTQLKELDKSIVSLNRQKLEVEAEIQPIRTANAQLYKVEQEIDRINNQKVSIDFSKAGDNLVGFGDKIVGFGDKIVGFGDKIVGFGDKIVGVVKKLATLGTAGAVAIGKLAKDAVNEASDLEQNTGGVQKLYGGSADKVIGDSKQAYKTAGISINEYLEQSTTFSASLIKALEENKLSQKDAQKQAADYAKQAIIDMSDNANVFGTNIGLIQNAYQGFAKGNYTMLDNLKLGFAGSQKGAMDLVNAYGGLDHKVTDISEVTMPLMIKSIHNAQEAMKISGTTIKEAEKTYEGSLNAMKAAWKNFLATGNAKGLAETVPIYFDNLDKKLKELTPKIIEGIKILVKELPSKIKPVIEDIKNILTQSLDEIFGKGFTKNFTDGMKPFTNTIKTIFDTLSKSSNGKKPDLSWMGSVIPDLLKVAVGLKVAGVAFKGVGGLLKGVDFIQNLGFKLPSFKGLSGFTNSTKEIKQIGVNDLKSLGMKMLTIAGISGNIYLAAKALEEVQKVGDLKGLQPKLLAIAEAVVGMGVLAAAAGFIAEKKPGLLIKGLMAVAGISGVIYLAAKTLQEVGDIDSDFGSVQSKIGQMALSITEIGLFAAAVGALMDTGVGAAVLASGLLAIVGIVGTIYLVAKALEEVSNLELNKKVIDNNLTTISEVLVDISKMSFKEGIIGKAGKLIKNFIDMGILAEFIKISGQLKQLENAELNDGKIEGTITSIKSMIEQFTQGSFVDSLKGFLTGGIKIGDLKAAYGILAEFRKISGQLKQLENTELNDGKIEGTITSIKSMIEQFTQGSFVDSLKGFLTGGIKIGDLKAAYGILAEFRKISGQLKQLENTELNDGKIEGTITSIKSMIEQFTQGSFVDSLKGFLTGGIKIGDLKAAYGIFSEFSKIADVLEDLQGRSLMEDSLLEEIGIIKKAIMSISKFSTGEIANNLTGLADALDRVINDLTKTYPPEFQDLGKLLARKTNKGFKSKLNLQSILSSKIKSLSSAGAENIGSKLAKAINDGVKNKLNIGNMIHDSIVKALSAKYNAKINVDLLTNKRSDNVGGYPTVVMASGGRVTRNSQLQDSPEKPLLANGEYVIPKKIVDALGVPFFDKLRRGPVSRTFAGLAQSVSNTTSSVVNNIYNTTNNHQNMNVYASAGQDVQMIANRRLRR